jgi:hypothetical protein
MMVRCRPLYIHVLQASPALILARMSAPDRLEVRTANAGLGLSVSPPSLKFLSPFNPEDRKWITTVDLSGVQYSLAAAPRFPKWK